MFNSVIYTLILLTFLVGAILLYIFLTKADKNQIIVDDIIEYSDIQTDTNTGVSFFDKLKLKNNKFIFEPKDTIKAIFTIVGYTIIFFIIASVISSIILELYCIENNLDYNIFVQSSGVFDQVEYDKMNVICSPYTNLFTYLLGLILVLSLNINYIIKDIKRFKKRLIPIIFIGLGLIYIASFIGSMMLSSLGIEATSSNEAELDKLFAGPILGVVALAFTTVILAPIVEELVFRKAIFNLCKNDTRKGILISSIFFGLIHVLSFVILAFKDMITGNGTYLVFISEFIYIIVYSLMGLAISITYVKSNRNIIVTIILHMLNNLISLILTLLLPYLNIQ